MSARLDALSIDDLLDLSRLVDALCRAGIDLQGRGLAPVFDLTPGQPVTIRLDAGLPHAWGLVPAATVAPPIDPTQTAAVSDVPTADTPPAADAPAPAAPDPGPEPPSPAVADEGQAAGAEPPAAADAAGDAPALPRLPGDVIIWPAAPVGLRDINLAAGAVPRWSPLPQGPDKPLPPVQQPPRWTEAEDARLVALVVEAMRNGATRRDGIRDFVAETGRPFAGTEFRASRILAGRIAAAQAAPAQSVPPVPSSSRGSAARVPPPEVPNTPAAAADPGRPEAAAAVTPPAAARDPLPQGEAPPIPPPPPTLEEHLAAIPRPPFWTTARDADLMRLACLGWKAQEIDIEMDMARGAAAARFEVLTDRRRFPREEVRAALEALAGQPA
ncbi:MAG TPA: hypothetical protein PKD10_05285 [Paracoccaceae bacterium]|nr:hypothetical protein [Paracoccaceae bacterium]HMO70106.1 hypothetical protein [Paracoccaceae bacterium]